MFKFLSSGKSRYLAAGFVFVSILGTLSHFFYEWSGGNPIIALFSPVNESTWEHMKLLFFPMLIWALFVPSSLNDSFPCLRSNILTGNIIGTLLIPVLFYTYSGILGFTVTIIDILIFFISVAVAFLFAGRYKKTDSTCENSLLINLMTILFICLFFIFSYYPPELGLFTAP